MGKTPTMQITTTMAQSENTILLQPMSVKENIQSTEKPDYYQYINQRSKQIQIIFIN